MDPNSLTYMVVRYWVPALIPIIIGGYFASILFPRWQSANVKARATIEHRLKLIEDLAVAFAKYITAWRRLVQIAQLQETRDLTETETERLNEFVNDRNDSRDELMELCARGQLYFTDKTCALIHDFVNWDQQQTAKTLPELPPTTEWREWEDKIITQLRQDERKHGY